MNIYYAEICLLNNIFIRRIFMNNSEPTTRKRFYCNKNDDEFKFYGIDDTPEAIENAMNKGATSLSSLSFSWLPDKNHRAPIRYGNLYLIFEKGKSLRINRTQAITMISFLHDYYKVDPLSLSFWISAKTVYILKFQQSFMVVKMVIYFYLLFIRNL